MNVNVREKDGVFILDLSGRLDINASDKINKTVDDILEKGGKIFLMNFSEVDFVSSPGLVILVSILKKIRKEQGRIALFNLQSYVREVFEVTQLTKVFEIFESEEEGIKSLKE